MKQVPNHQPVYKQDIYKPSLSHGDFTRSPNVGSALGLGRVADIRMVLYLPGTGNQVGGHDGITAVSCEKRCGKANANHHQIE